MLGIFNQEKMEIATATLFDYLIVEITDLVLSIKILHLNHLLARVL